MVKITTIYKPWSSATWKGVPQHNPILKGDENDHHGPINLWTIHWQPILQGESVEMVTPLKFNSSPLKRRFPKRKLDRLNQPSWLSGAFAVNFQGCNWLVALILYPWMNTYFLVCCQNWIIASRIFFWKVFTFWKILGEPSSLQLVSEGGLVITILKNPLSWFIT